MDFGAQSYDYKNFVSFVNEIEQHQRNSDNFFDIELLKIISKHFNYGDTCIAIHDEKRYIGSIAQNKVLDLIPVYTDSFHKRDSLAQYINNKLEKKETHFRTIIKSTDIYPDSAYDNSDYAAFLRVAGLRYAAILPFGDFRLCIYKADEDFAKTELEILAAVYSVLFNKLETFCCIRDTRLVGKLKNRLIDNIGVGFMIFDANYVLVEFNQTALRHYNLLFNKNTIRDVFTDFLSLFRGVNGSRQLQHLPIFKQYRGFKLTISSYAQADNLKMITKYYYVIIEEEAGTKGSGPLNKRCGLFDDLSRRETEILELFCHGMEYPEIGAALFISPYTVRAHLRNIYKKLSINNQRELIHLYNQAKQNF